MSLSEWKEFVSRGLARPEASTEPEFVLHGVEDVSALPTSVDWRTGSQVAVTTVKDQGQCGSCWSFSATGALEGAYYLKTKKLVDFSPQHFVDCDTRSNSNNKGTDMGCNGGLMDSAFSWASKNKGLCEWNDYKYTSGTTKKSGTCSESSCKKSDHSPASYTDVAKNSDTALMTALAQQPVSVAIEADTKEFQLYKSGVFTAKCGAKLDHGVLAVGYGHDSASNQDYWTVKNSWGTSWGDKGYILLQRGGSGLAKEGQCGILSGPPSYPNFK
jgi:KDEL-tailed cysteine endopeptidase